MKLPVFTTTDFDELTSELAMNLFLRKLHPIVSHHLGTMAYHTMPIQQLRDLTQKAFNKHKASTKGVCKTPLILNCTT